MRIPVESDAQSRHHLRDKTAWVFDLDNTLYPASANLFAQIDPLMTGFIAMTLEVSEDEANLIRKDTWQRYGATLSGLMELYDVDPEAFLEASHRLDLSVLSPDPSLAAAISALPGQKMIHTNGPRDHAERVLKARGLTGLFSDIIAIEDTGFVPKPNPLSTSVFLEQTGISPDSAIMLEDQAANLMEPARLGMATVWVTDGPDQDPDHVHHVTRDLTAFLESVLG